MSNCEDRIIALERDLEAAEFMLRQILKFGYSLQDLNGNLVDYHVALFRFDCAYRELQVLEWARSRGAVA